MVNYSLAHMSTKPGVENAPKKYYAKAQANGEITMDEIAEDISYATSLTDGDVLNALRALIQQINKNLAAGKIVRLENFGTFQFYVNHRKINPYMQPAQVLPSHRKNLRYSKFQVSVLQYCKQLETLPCNLLEK